MDARREQLKSEILRRRGYFGPFHEAALRFDPTWLERYLAFVSAPKAAGRIPERLVHLIYVAIDSTPTHIYERGIGIHIALARKHGATSGQIVETFEIATGTAGLTGEAAMPVLLEELAAAGKPAPQPDPAMRDRVRQEFLVRTGFYPDWVDGALALSPEFATAFLDLVATPWDTGTLPPKDRSFIALACYASPAVACVPGIRRHVREALRLGATGEELADVLALASGIGIHPVSVGLPILLERLAADPEGDGGGA